MAYARRTYRDCFREVQVAGESRLQCELCEEEKTTKPASYTGNATSKLKAHVLEKHKGFRLQSDRHAQPDSREPKKMKLTTESVFSAMMNAGKNKNWSAGPDFKLVSSLQPTTAESTDLMTNEKPTTAPEMPTLSLEAPRQFQPRLFKAPPFSVIEYGDTGTSTYHLVPDSIDVTRLCSAQKLQRYQMQPVQDIIQNNYTIRRVMVGHDDEEVAVMFRALVSNGGATFQISLEHHGWGA